MLAKSLKTSKFSSVFAFVKILDFCTLSQTPYERRSYERLLWRARDCCGSMPCDLMTGIAIGPVRKLSNARATPRARELQS
jgi:hypothetical protein